MANTDVIRQLVRKLPRLPDGMQPVTVTAGDKKYALKAIRLRRVGDKLKATKGRK